VVGSRRMTSYGRRITNELIAGLASSDVVIVSGLALGIDGEAHRAALANGLVTWAVLGSGFGHLYPPQHKELALSIVENGGTLLSEYWPDTKPEPHHFPARNRIIAALADAVLVVEADQKSGSLITVDHALDLGRDIWAVPGNVTSRFSRGTNNLLRHGATLIASSEDILAEWNWGVRAADDEGEVPPLQGANQLVYQVVGHQNTTLEEIVEASGLTTAEVLAALMELELGGWVEAAAAQSYRRTPVKT
ncbi:MAG TPA: DNA-protecting protein DprA, partial [Firmicutes bacterium]|nr:DNA-protecting protein DprA [Bacillota bacterium]